MSDDDTVNTVAPGASNRSSWLLRWNEAQVFRSKTCAGSGSDCGLGSLGLSGLPVGTGPCNRGRGFLSVKIGGAPPGGSCRRSSTLR
jgi:hypothetical protein